MEFLLGRAGLPAELLGKDVVIMAILLRAMPEEINVVLEMKDFRQQ